MRTPPIIPPPIPGQRLTAQEIQQLAYAKSMLENPGLTARISNLLGSPIEKGFKLLPKNWSDTVNKTSRAALLKALEVAVVTMGGSRQPRKASEGFHKLLVGASGGIGGAFGLAALAIELPISTTIMLRSIADIARSEGHEPRAVETKLACLEVFALGGRSPSDDAVESGYWAVRAGLARAISEAAAYLTEKGVLEKTAPAVMRLISSISARFGVIVSEQVAAKAVPIVGAAGGSIINVLFMNHFQEMARGHFIVKRLEAKYGTELVRLTYNSLAVPIR
jgi:hypothetical protein